VQPITCTIAIWHDAFWVSIRSQHTAFNVSDAAHERRWDAVPTHEHKCFTRSVLQRRSLFTSPLPPPANCEQLQPTLKKKSRGVNLDKEHGNVNVSLSFFWYSYPGTSNLIRCQSSEDVMPEATGRGNDKVRQRELIARIQTSSPVETSHLSAAYPPSHRSQRTRPSTVRRVWAMINSSRHHPLVSEFIPLHL